MVVRCGDGSGGDVREKVEGLLQARQVRRVESIDRLDICASQVPRDSMKSALLLRCDPQDAR
jgi:hypothetical protein